MSANFSHATGRSRRTALAICISIVVAAATWFGGNSLRGDEGQPALQSAGTGKETAKTEAASNDKTDDNKNADAQAAKRVADDQAYFEYSKQRWKVSGKSDDEQPTVEIEPIASEHRQVAAMRKAARALDQMAAELDAEDLSNEADQLFAQAQVLRSAARSLRRRPYLQPPSESAAALQYNLHTLRAHIQLYQSEHDGQFPQVKPDLDGNPSLPQLCESTNSKGESGTGPEHPHGPYIISLPHNNLAPDKQTAQTIIAIDHWPPKETSPKGGWFYHALTGQIAPNAAGWLNE